MKTGLFIICCLFVVTGCRNKNRIPAGIIPQKKMQAILWDIMRADQFVTDFVPRKDSGFDKSTESIKLYTQVFAIHQISKEQFEKSFSFYKAHPALFKVILDSLSKPGAEPPTQMIVPPGQAASYQPVPGKERRPDSVVPQRKMKVVD